ncbi:DUF4180 domain-containing protein [Streptomyces sp. NPDC101227]|uniref:DUF4180 domain-containing protein n=1 Tax=Streptomyces sp. NPDC101227 TaxID=3366136 RepID=UPI00382A8A24
MSAVQKIDDVPVLMCAPEGEAIGSARDVMDFLGAAMCQGGQWAVIPAGRFDEAFFRLRTLPRALGVARAGEAPSAGEIIQKFVNHRVGIAVLGDISRYTEDSSVLRDFVRECNRGRQTWFLADVEELRERLRG